MRYHAAPLRAVAEFVGLPEIAKIALEPGVKSVYRVTVNHPDGDGRNSVATVRNALIDNMKMEIVYQGLFDHKPIKHISDDEKYAAFEALLRKVRFDNLPDQPGIALYGETLWLLERAAGSFYKSVILSPTKAEAVYGEIVNAIRDNFPEAVRGVK